MTEFLARRIVLATIESSTFEFVADNTQAVSCGEAVQEDFGFTIAEVNQATVDRNKIARRYRELRPKRSFMRSEITAKIEWLMSDKEGPALTPAPPG